MDKKSLIIGLEGFIKDESYFENFKNIDIVQGDVLVRLCVIVPPEDKAGNIILQDEKGNFKKASQLLDTTYLPVVKVIKKGGTVENDKIEVGACYTVPPNEIMGDTTNPEFIHAQQFKSEGQAALKLTKDIKPRLPKLVVNWGKYVFHNPWNFEEDERIDNEVFLIPWNKLKMKISEGYKYEIKNKKEELVQ